MLLYHGTSERHARHIWEKGIKPRQTTGGATTWQNAPSRKDCVYLTTAYAGYFAANASEGDERWAIIEIDSEKLHPHLFLPDEDFILQARRMQGENLPESALATIRRQLDRYAACAEDSIKLLGNCAYRGTVPPEAITRISLFNPVSCKQASFQFLEPTITIQNYRFVGQRYQELLKWIMGDEYNIDMIFPFIDALPELAPQREQINKEFAKRHLEVWARQPEEVAV